MAGPRRVKRGRFDGAGPEEHLVLPAHPSRGVTAGLWRGKLEQAQAGRRRGTGREVATLKRLEEKALATLDFDAFR